MRIDPDEWAHLEPYCDTIQIYRNGNLMYEGPVIQVEYSWEYLGIRIPSKEE